MRGREPSVNREAVHGFGNRCKSFLVAFDENEQKRKGTMYRAPTRKTSSDRVLELFFFGDVDRNLSGDVAKDFDGDGIFAEGLDGIGELDLALIDFEILRGEAFGDVGGGYGAEHLIVFASLAREVQRDAVDQRRLFLRGVELVGGFFRKRGTNPLEGFHVADAGFNSELARQKKIASVAGLDGDDFASVAEFFDIFLKNDLHEFSLSSCFA